MVLDIIAAVITYAAVGVGAWFIGGYMVKVYKGERVWLSRVVGPVERATYKIIGVDAEHEQGWISYLVSLLAVTVVSIAFTYVVLRFQNYLPLNPENFPGVPAPLAFNTAMSFATNTNWQNYAGETTMSYFSQIVALVIHQFLSAAVGMAVAIVVIRAIARRTMSTLGNFWTDMVRGILYILLPISVVLALVLVAFGSIQNFSNYTVVHTLTNGLQTIAQGPVASMEAIKDLGTNGGGFFNANAAHPFENPNGFTNSLEIFICLLIPFGLTITFGKWVGHVKQGIVLGAVMGIILVGGFGATGQPSARGHRGNASGVEPTRRRQHGRQGGAVRADSERALQLSNNGHEHWFRRRVAGQHDAHRRSGLAGVHQAGRDHAGRRRLGSVRHGRLRDRRRLHRRPHGRTHARISR
jgi:K+-transporting ATPase ATPase A chain